MVRIGRKRETKEWKREKQISCREKCVKIRERGAGKIINFTINVVVSDGTKDDHHRQLCSFWLFIKMFTMMHFCWTNFFFMSILSYNVFSYDTLSLSPSTPLPPSPSLSLSLSLSLNFHSLVLPLHFSTGQHPCHKLKCTPPTDCLVDRFGIASCVCPPPCPKVMIPVCGSDGKCDGNILSFFLFSLLRSSLEELLCLSQGQRSLSRLISIQRTFFLFPPKTPLVEMKK